MSNTTAIAAAVEPLRAFAKEHAAKGAAELADRSIAAYEADPASIDPTFETIRSLGRTECALHSAKVARLRSLTTVKGGKFVGDDKKVAAFIKDAEERASAQYTAFIQKLEMKVGEHTAATLEGNHVWFTSLLTVTKADGSTEKWFTQQIANISKLGRPFPQWPSRKVKA